jgi:hypothetical protein
LALAAVVALAAPSCTEERTLSADEFVADVNEGGAELTLGEPLHTDDESEDLYAVTLEPPPAEEPAGHEREQGHEEGHQHEGGSLSVHDDVADAEERLAACKASADLLCYRAANIVVVIEGGGAQAQRLGEAIRKLADE